MKRRISLSMSTSAMNAHENARCDHRVRVANGAAAAGTGPCACACPGPCAANATAVEKGTASDVYAAPPGADDPAIDWAPEGAAAVGEAAMVPADEEEQPAEAHWHSMRARSCGKGTCFRNM